VITIFSVCLCIFPSTSDWLNLMRLVIRTMAPEPTTTAYLINPSHQFVCLYVHLSMVSRRRLYKKITAAANTHATIEELLDAPFSKRSVSYQRKQAISFS
jgi:hypothetical protein